MKIVKKISNYGYGSYAEIWHKEDDKNYYHREDGPASREYRINRILDKELDIE